MEQKEKKYEELNKYERAMTNASLEQRLEAMALDLAQIAKALKISVHIDATYYDHSDDAGVTVYFIPENGTISRHVKEVGDLFGIIEEALGKPTKTQTEE